MADHRCWRCEYRKDAGPRDVRDKIRCVPDMKIGGPAPFWAEDYQGKKLPVYEDLDSRRTRMSETCPRFKEQGGERGK
jgi:hypothetical protein